MVKKRSLKFDKPVCFSNRVLIGNWVEERSAYERNNFKHKSIYSDEFGHKPFDRGNSNFVWDQKLIAEGNGVVSTKTSDESCTFYDNYSTTYDLSYKCFPIWYKAPIFRNLKFRLGTYEPREEYLRSYGNISNYGLADYKMHEWKCDVQDPRTTVMTSYDDEFPSPGKSDYTYSHWCRDTAKIGNHPSLPKCNIITWECKGDSCCQENLNK